MVLPCNLVQKDKYAIEFDEYKICGVIELLPQLKLVKNLRTHTAAPTAKNFTSTKNNNVT